MIKKQAADAIFQREVWAQIDAMIPRNVDRGHRKAASLGAEAAIYGLSLLVEMMDGLLRKTPSNHGEIEPLVIEALVRNPRAAESRIAKWKVAMVGLSGFVRTVPVRADQSNASIAMLWSVLDAVDYSQLPSSSIAYVREMQLALLMAEVLRPNTAAESILLRFGEGIHRYRELVAAKKASAPKPAARKSASRAGSEGRGKAGKRER